MQPIYSAKPGALSRFTYINNAPFRIDRDVYFRKGYFSPRIIEEQRQRMLRKFEPRMDNRLNILMERINRKRNISKFVNSLFKD